MLQIAPSGTFTAVTPYGIVGTAIGIDYGNFGWIAMMLVNPAYRSHGLGARLLEAAMGALPRDVPIRLDATPLGRPLYERYGFVLESSLTRHVWPAGERERLAPSGTVRPLGKSDLSAVMETDERISGAHRHRALRWIIADAPRYAWIRTGDRSACPTGCGRWPPERPLVVRSLDNARLVECDSTSANLGDDLVGGLVPDEWLGVVVPVGDPGADRGDEIADGAVGAALDPLAGQLGEPALDEVQP